MLGETEMIINKAYSLLVYGSRPIPAEFCKYRTYGKLSTSSELIDEISDHNTDPYLRAYLADYIIELSKRSSLYSYLKTTDKHNTYDSVTSGIVPGVAGIPNTCVPRLSNTFPELCVDITSIGEDSVTYLCNGAVFTKSCSNVGSGNISFQVHDIQVILPKTSYDVSFVVSSAVSGKLPKETSVRNHSSCLEKHIRDNIDYSYPPDIAAAVCLEVITESGYAGV